MMTYYDCKAEESRIDNFVVDNVRASFDCGDEFVWWLNDLEKVAAESENDYYKKALREISKALDTIVYEIGDHAVYGYDEEDMVCWAQEIVEEIVGWVEGVNEAFNNDTNIDEAFREDTTLGYDEPRDVVKGWAEY